MKKSFRNAAAVSAVVAALLTGAGAPVASAGEVTGNGKVKPVNGRSECAYSGLDDVDEGETPETDDFGRTQNYGQIVRYAGSLGGLPKYGCNPTGIHGFPG